MFVLYIQYFGDLNIRIDEQKGIENSTMIELFIFKIYWFLVSIRKSYKLFVFSVNKLIFGDEKPCALNGIVSSRKKKSDKLSFAFQFYFAVRLDPLTIQTALIAKAFIRVMVWIFCVILCNPNLVKIQPELIPTEFNQNSQ